MSVAPLGRLRVSQPAVSRQIHDLEDELGVALFDRAHDGLTMTNAGESFLVHARDILRKSAEASAHMNSFRERPVKKLAVGYIPSVLTDILTPALRTFNRKHSDTEVSLKELAPQDQVKSLRDGRIDLALPGNPCPELAAEFDVVTLRRVFSRPCCPTIIRWPGEPALPSASSNRRPSLALTRNNSRVAMPPSVAPAGRRILRLACFPEWRT